eukprot:2647500-Alexandrium_andersonii.AAC.1
MRGAVQALPHAAAVVVTELAEDLLQGAFADRAGVGRDPAEDASRQALQRWLRAWRHSPEAPVLGLDAA